MESLNLLKICWLYGKLDIILHTHFSSRSAKARRGNYPGHGIGKICGLENHETTGGEAGFVLHA